MKILVLGGVAESKTLAHHLIATGHKVIYSIAGLVRQPNLDCTVHSGGFSQYGRDGIDGLVTYLSDQNIELLFDATHPYAEEMSANAMVAATRRAIPCWRYARPGWDRSRINNLHCYREMGDLLPMIATYQRPFFSIGVSTLQHADLRPTHQRWIVRSAKPFPPRDGIIQINAIGPFTLADELALMQQHRIDALISKDSGCTRVQAKVEAANQFNIPVFIQDRPILIPAHREFASVEASIAAIASY